MPTVDEILARAAEMSSAYDQALPQAETQVQALVAANQAALDAAVQVPPAPAPFDYPQLADMIALARAAAQHAPAAWALVTAQLGDDFLSRFSELRHSQDAREAEGVLFVLVTEARNLRHAGTLRPLAELDSVSPAEIHSDALRAARELQVGQGLQAAISAARRFLRGATH